MEIATAVGTGLVGAAVVWGATEHDIGWGDSGPGSGYFPFRIGLLIIVASLVNLVLAIRRTLPENGPFVTAAQARSVLISAYLGLYVGAILYLVFVMVFQGGYRLLFAIGLALAVAAAMRLIFPVWFKVPLLTGPLEALLGLY
jgi:hypothetical protein